MTIGLCVTDQHSRILPNGVNKLSFYSDDWLQTFPPEYDKYSKAASKRRADARERALGHRPRNLDFEQAARRDRAIQNAIGRRDLIERRLNIGYEWRGGFVGANRRYVRPAFVHEGLVSQDHAILQLFVTKLPRAAELLSGATKAEALPTDSKLLALDAPYVCGNQKLRGFLRQELDRDFESIAALRDAIDACCVRQPNLIVSYQTSDGKILRPHLIWLLRGSVGFMSAHRQGPQRLMSAVLRGLALALARIGADPGALSNPMRVKNPLSPLWDRWILVDRPYDLSELKAGINLNVSADELAAAAQAAAEGRSNQPEVHQDPQADSNALFRIVAAYAREIVESYRATASRGEFDHAVSQFAHQSNEKLRDQQLLRLVTSVCEWTWHKYLVGKNRGTLPAAERLARRQEAGRKTAALRHAATEAALIATYRSIVDKGEKPTQAAVASVSGRSERTVRSYWEAVLASATEPKSLKPEIRSLRKDKKEFEMNAQTIRATEGKPMSSPINIYNEMIKKWDQRALLQPARGANTNERRAHLYTIWKRIHGLPRKVA